MTEEEVKKELEYFQNHPMFMKEMPENPEDNKYLQALQALKFEGAPSDVAIEFLEKSKDSLEIYKSNGKFNSLKEAMYYICNGIDHVKDDSTVPDKIKYDLFFYRSSIQILIKNWGYAIDDLKQAIFYCKEDDAYFRIIQCYVILERFEEALKLINNRQNSLKKCDDDISKLKLYDTERAKVISLQNELISKLTKYTAFKDKSNEEKMKIYSVLSKRGIKLRPAVHSIPPNSQADIYLDEEGRLHFPLLVLYDEFGLTDYIQDIVETTEVSEILSMVLGEDNYLPFDKDKKYNSNTCMCYYEISSFDAVLKKDIISYYPLRNDDKLIDILADKRIYLSGFPVINIVSQISNFFPHFVKKNPILKRRRK